MLLPFGLLVSALNFEPASLSTLSSVGVVETVARIGAALRLDEPSAFVIAQGLHAQACLPGQLAYREVLHDLSPWGWLPVA